MTGFGAGTAQQLAPFGGSMATKFADGRLEQNEKNTIGWRGYTCRAADGSLAVVFVFARLPHPNVALLQPAYFEV